MKNKKPIAQEITEITEGTILTVMFAESTGGTEKISVNILLKGRYNAFRASYKRKVSNVEPEKKEFNEVKSFLDKLKSDAKVKTVDALIGKKIKIEFDGDIIEKFWIIDNFTPINKEGFKPKT